jgi:hypothetical protein
VGTADLDPVVDRDGDRRHQSSHAELDMRGTDVAAQRGGRRRATQQDVVRDALVAALAEALDVDADRLAVSLTLDDAPVPADRLPLELELVEAATSGASGDAAPADDAADERATASAARDTSEDGDEDGDEDAPGDAPVSSGGP